MSTEGFIILFLIMCYAIWAVTRKDNAGMRTVGYILLAVVAFFLLMGVIGNG